MQTIMIVEDDPDIRDGVRILLSGEGYRILEAENGPRALSLLTPEVDLVILDIMMPGMSGLRVCEEIRKTSTVPFYAWSPVYTLNFSAGEITALLYYNGFDACYSTGCGLLLIICLASFPLFFLWGSRGIVKYIVQLSEEIQAMEGGDLDHPITVQGSDELTTLASSLDSMRFTLRQQHEDEAAPPLTPSPSASTTPAASCPA